MKKRLRRMGWVQEGQVLRQLGSETRKNVKRMARPACQPLIAALMARGNRAAVLLTIGPPKAGIPHAKRRPYRQHMRFPHRSIADVYQIDDTADRTPYGAAIAGNGDVTCPEDLRTKETSTRQAID